MSTCSEPGCDQVVAAKGLCSRHYQQKRRGSSPTGHRGPAPKYAVRPKHGGAPQLGLRLNPAVMAWVKDHGGSTWLRALVEHLHTSGSITVADQRAFYNHVQRLVAGAFKEARRAHDGQVDPGSVGKRIASQLWAELRVPPGTEL
jgi:hypothetical protein